MRPLLPTCVVLPVSSSMCTRVIPISRVRPSTSIRIRPPTQIGRSYWLIW
jgi:hypothetical protein